MNADAFRYLYNYHFAENRKIWNWFVVDLSEQEFTQSINYSIGSLKNQILHLMSVDKAWFSGLRKVDDFEDFTPVDFQNREEMRVAWDKVEEDIRAYLATIKDEDLLSKPFDEGEDKDLILWQILLHVVNHGTDHRAQILRAIHDMGIKTPPQDLVFYVYDNPS